MVKVYLKKILSWNAISGRLIKMRLDKVKLSKISKKASRKIYIKLGENKLGEMR